MMANMGRIQRNIGLHRDNGKEAGNYYLWCNPNYHFSSKKGYPALEDLRDRRKDCSEIAYNDHKERHR